MSTAPEYFNRLRRSVARLLKAKTHEDGLFPESQMSGLTGQLIKMPSGRSYLLHDAAYGLAISPVAGASTLRTIIGEARYHGQSANLTLASAPKEVQQYFGTLDWRCMIEKELVIETVVRTQTPFHNPKCPLLWEPSLKEYREGQARLDKESLQMRKDAAKRTGTPFDDIAARCAPLIVNHGQNVSPGFKKAMGDCRKLLEGVILPNAKRLIAGCCAMAFAELLPDEVYEQIQVMEEPHPLPVEEHEDCQASLFGQAIRENQELLVKLPHPALTLMMEMGAMVNSIDRNGLAGALSYHPAYNYIVATGRSIYVAEVEGLDSDGCFSHFSGRWTALHGMGDAFIRRSSLKVSDQEPREILDTIEAIVSADTNSVGKLEGGSMESEALEQAWAAVGKIDMRPCL